MYMSRISQPGPATMELHCTPQFSTIEGLQDETLSGEFLMIQGRERVLASLLPDQDGLDAFLP